MLTNYFYSTVIFLSTILHVSGQDLNIREQVDLHLNTRSLLTGESLYFSAFVTSAATGQPSPLSGILYVELAGKNGMVFQKKILLKEGRGQGEFFVSSLVPTGRYQLLAYTRWMKNFNDYFQAPITIINPFEAYEKPVEANPPLPEIDFYPEGGSLVAGKQNVIVFRISDPSGEQLSWKGRIVTAAGGKLADIEADSKGIGRFTLTPESGQSYQAIVEDARGEFHFFKLPVATTNTKSIQLRNRDKVFSITVLSSSPDAEEVFLTVSDGQNAVFEQAVFTNTPVLLKKESLKPGVFKASAKDGSGKQLSVRLFHHGDLQRPAGENSGRYVPRALVQIPVQPEEKARVSVSVRKSTSFEHHPGLAATALFGNLYDASFAAVEQTGTDNQMIMASWKWPTDPDNDLVRFLPDLRGEIISGKLISNSGGDVKNKLVSYSITGENYQLQTARTDGQGRFVLQITPVQGEREAYLSVLNEDEPYIFTLDNPFLDTYPDFDYAPLNLDSALVAQLVKRSIRNQIENAYYDRRIDSSQVSSSWLPVFGDFDYFYVMDDYNRFPEMFEHFIEYIPSVVARKNKNRSKIKVLVRYVLPDKEEPLLVIDGVPTSAERMLDFNPYKIESIGVINTRFFLGPLVADGVVSLRTFDNDLQGFPVGENTLKIDHQGLEPVPAYTFPDYSEDLQLRIPDYRDQLYWQPQVTISPEKPYLLEFYTSDTTGRFEITIEGYTESGEPLSIRKYFTVEANQPVSN